MRGARSVWQVDGRKDRVWIFKLVLITLNTGAGFARNQITAVLKVLRYLDPLPSVSSNSGDPFYRSFIAAVGTLLSRWIV